MNPNTVTAEDNEKNQPLSHCRGGTSVKRLADFGAAVDHQNGEGKTALRVLAAEPTLAEVTKALLDQKAKPSISDRDGCMAARLFTLLLAWKTMKPLIFFLLAASKSPKKIKKETLPCLLLLTNSIEK